MSQLRERLPRGTRWLSRSRGVIYSFVPIALGALYASLDDIKHPPLALKIFFVAGAVFALLAYGTLAIVGIYIAKDWLWLRRDDWRKSRERVQRQAP
jgi:hypothetical protein